MPPTRVMKQTDGARRAPSQKAPSQVDRLLRSVLRWIKQLFQPEQEKKSTIAILAMKESPMAMLLLLDRPGQRATRTWRVRLKTQIVGQSRNPDTLARGAALPDAQNFDVMITLDNLFHVAGQTTAYKRNRRATHRLAIWQVEKSQANNALPAKVCCAHSWDLDMQGAMTRMGEQMAVTIVDELASKLLTHRYSQIDWYALLDRTLVRYLGQGCSLSNQPQG